MRSSSVLLLLPMLVLASGCRGNLLATAELHGPGAADAHFQSTGGPLVLWADTDGKWTGSSTRYSYFPAHYEIDVLSKGAKVGHISCDTHESSSQVCRSKVTVNSTHSGDCELKLPCTVPTIPAGDATLHVVGTTSKEVISVSKMSINVRDQ